MTRTDRERIDRETNIQGNRHRETYRGTRTDSQTGRETFTTKKTATIRDRQPDREA